MLVTFPLGLGCAALYGIALTSLVSILSFLLFEERLASPTCIVQAPSLSALAAGLRNAPLHSTKLIDDQESELWRDLKAHYKTTLNPKRVTMEIDIQYLTARAISLLSIYNKRQGF